MFKKVILPFILSFIIAVGWYFLYQSNTPPKNFETNLGDELQNISYEDEDDLNIEEEYISEVIDIEKEIELIEKEHTRELSQEDLATQERIDMLKKRFTLRETISKGDNYTSGNQYILALGEYLKALRQNPSDHQVIIKIAEVYFILNKYESSFDYFSQALPRLNQEQRHKYILSILYSLDFNSNKSIAQATENIKTSGLSKQDIFYYLNSINCTIDFHKCKKNFEEYFEKKPDLSHKQMLDIKQAITNYNNFQINNLYYKDALIIGALFQNQLYSISNNLALKTLKIMPDYKPILLIAGKGYYEIGDLKNAKTYLESYYHLEPKDIEVSFILGDIYFHLKDYDTSNLYFNVALKNGFQDQLNLQRKLAYNYYLLEDKRSMLNVFGYLINDKNSNIDDHSLAIYHAILEKRTANAAYWAKKAIETFKDQEGYEAFYGYLGWISREDKKYNESKQYLQEGLKINARNPLILLNLGYLESALGNYNTSLVYFKRTMSINGNGEFGGLAKIEIQKIETFLKQQDKK